MGVGVYVCVCVYVYVCVYASEPLHWVGVSIALSNCMVRRF